MKSGSKMVNELTTHEVIELSRNFKSIGGKSITLTGGEPTLRKDLFEIVDFLNSLDIDVLLLSNGYQWNETTINQISKKKIKEIQFSIDGFDEETNSLIRGKGAFTNCMNNVDHLCKLGKRVSIAITPPYNILKNSQTKYIDFVKLNGYFEYRRSEQSKYWMYESINEQLRNSFYNNPTIEGLIPGEEAKVLQGQETSFVAAKHLLDTYFKLLKD